jgi:hypothetical protein
MAQIISLVVYEINGVKLKQTQTLGFSVDNFIVYPYTGTNISLQSTIEVLSNDASKTFSVVESQATIRDLANAGGISGADNGLNTDYGPVELGGELTKNTTIDISDYTFNFNDGQGWNFNMATGQMLLGLTQETDGNNSFIQILNNTITNKVVDSDSDNYFSTLQNSFLYKITTNQYYSDWDTNNQYDILTGFYNQFTELRFNYFNNDNGFLYQQAFTINNTKGFAGNFIAKYNFQNLPAFSNNAAALAAGLSVGDIYRNTSGNGDALNIVH